ncbi:hypothetical protein [uncultured Thiodictyon sp.]|uniref:hypothetical protein n=1 Tax=uncultured Thiodictyon sp. TaxID=1846217 RepID=UPI0025FD2A89|nr:hypothetical protein [uncultured Thiodictyon sp.]
MGMAKISPEFDRRLNALGPADRIQALLLLKVPNRGRRAGTRTSIAERAEVADMIDATGEVPEIDRILHDHGGRRLAERANALGSLPVETPPAGLRALAASGQARAIIEDQPISMVH